MPSQLLPKDLFVTVKDLATNSFSITAYRPALVRFREAVVRRRLLESKFPISSADRERMEASGAKGGDEADECSALCYFRFIQHELQQQWQTRNSGVTTAFDLTKHDWEDGCQKKLSVFTVESAMSHGVLVLCGRVGTRFTSIVALPLDALHAVAALLPAPSHAAGKEAPRFRLLLLSEKKYNTGSEHDGEWTIQVEVGAAAAAAAAGGGSRSAASLDFFFTLKPRSELEPLVAATSTRLPPLPEEEDDVCGVLRFGPLRVLRGTAEALPPLPRDPRKFALPADTIAGAKAVDIPELAAAQCARLEPQTSALSATIGVDAVSSVRYNQGWRGGDGGFTQHVAFTLRVTNVSGGVLPAALRGPPSVWYLEGCPEATATSGPEAIEAAAAAAAASGSGGWRLATSSQFESGGRDASDDGAVVLGALESRVVQVCAAFLGEGECGRDNSERLDRLHPMFPSPCLFRVTLAEAPALGSSGAVPVAAESLVRHTLYVQPRVAALKLRTEADVLAKVRSDNGDTPIEALECYVAVDDPVFRRRLHAWAFVNNDGFVLARSGSQSFVDHATVDRLGWLATRNGLNEMEIESFAYTDGPFAVRAFALIDRAKYPPMVAGVRMEATGPGGARSSRSCHFRLLGEGWFTANEQPSAEAPSPNSSSGGRGQPPPGDDARVLASVETAQANDPQPHVATTPIDPVAGAAQPTQEAAHAVPAAAPAAAAGTLIMQERLGAGGFGVVYRAFDPMLGHFVAVKETPLNASPAQCAALQAEFATLTSLHHPNIVTVTSLRLDDGVARVVMEWMPGGSLGSVLRRAGHRLHEAAIRRFMRDALLGLAYLHERGICHLDIKPENMLLAADGTMKLADFGTAKIAETGQSAVTNRVVGTPAYMPPELISSGKYYQGSDLWALACSAVEMASGEQPWGHLDASVRGAALPLLFHIASAKPPHHCPRVPTHLTPDLQRILAACFAPTIASRPTAAALLRDSYFAAQELPADVEGMGEFQRSVSTSDATSGTSAESRLATLSTLGTPDTWTGGSTSTGTWTSTTSSA